MNEDLLALTGVEHPAAWGRARELARSLAIESCPEEFGDTVCLTLLAGAGTRWVETLAAAKLDGGARTERRRRDIATFPLEAPRGLFPVRNYISKSPFFIPLAAYAIDALRGLGRHTIVVRGWEKEIREQILSTLGIEFDSVAFRTQREGPFGKVLGHGDAARQAIDLFENSRYVIVNFGGDANSPLTARAGLSAISWLEKEGAETDLLLPVAEIANPAYPILLDEGGLPRAFGHDKLLGDTKAGDRSAVRAYTNVGIRIYRAKALAATIRAIVKDYWSEGSGYSIPGNDPNSHEFALDNVDAAIARRGKARILPIASPDELTPAKSFTELERFEAAIKKVRAEWDGFRVGLDAEKAPNKRPGDRVNKA
jgi:hypothetical protein